METRAREVESGEEKGGGGGSQENGTFNAPVDARRTTERGSLVLRLVNPMHLSLDH